jgi:hypothetical protein
MLVHRTYLTFIFKSTFLLCVCVLLHVYGMYDDTAYCRTMQLWSAGTGTYREPSSWALVHKTTYAPMIYTALCIMFWMRAYPLSTWASRRGLGPGIREFFGPVKWHQADRRVPLGAQKLKNSRAQPAPTCLSR